MNTAKYATLALFLCILSGCGGDTRQASDSDKVIFYNITHKKSLSDAYNISEVWIGETFVSAKTVIDVKQPSTGIIIAKAIKSAPEPMIDPIFNVQDGYSNDDHNYVLKIENSDGHTKLTFTILSRTGVQALSVIRKDFDNSANGLTTRLDGSISSASPVPDYPAPVSATSSTPVKSYGK